MRQSHERRACSINSVLVAMEHVGRRRFTDTDAQAQFLIERTLQSVVEPGTRRSTASGFVVGDVKGDPNAKFDTIENAISDAETRAA